MTPPARANGAKECQARRPSATFAILSANFTNGHTSFVFGLANLAGPPDALGVTGWRGGQIDLAREKSQRLASLDQIERDAERTFAATGERMASVIAKCRIDCAKTRRVDAFLSNLSGTP
jgi:hypothetical protein